MCPREEIFLYVDGELSQNQEFDLDTHIAGCKVCADELNAQKKVSNSLEIVLEEEMKNIELPENFAQVIATKAEGNVSGLRQLREISLALIICAVLFSVITVGVGIEATLIWGIFGKFVDPLAAVFGFVFRLVYDMSVGVLAILRSLNHKFVFSSFISLFLLIVVFIVTFLSLSRLVFRYNRS